MLEVLGDIDEMSRRRPEVLGFFSVRSHPPATSLGHLWGLAWPRANRPLLPACPPQTCLQRLMSSAEESCRHLAFSLALRSIQSNPR